VATIFRGPLFSQQKRNPELRSPSTGVNLLTSTLFVAAAALPFNNAQAFTAPQHPSHTLSVNADTSRGTPKTLFADAARPSFDAPTFAPQHPPRALNQDSSKGIPKTLYADSANPVSNKPHTAPDRIRPGTDTSKGSTQALLAPVGSPPFVPAPFVGPQTVRRNLADTSQSTPVGFFPVAGPTPFLTPPTAAQVDSSRLREARSDVQPNLSVLFPPSMIAPGLPESWTIYRLPVTPTDTSFRAFALFSGPPPAPFFNSPQTGLERQRPIPDTSQGTAKALYADALAAFVNAPGLQVDRLRPVADTSQESPAVLLNAVVAPFVNPPPITPDRLRLSEDTSQSTAKVLYNDAVAPVFNPSALQVDRIRPVTDTTAGLNLPVSTIIPGIPFAQTDWPAPIEWRKFYQTQAGFAESPGVIPDAIPVVGGAGEEYGSTKKKRRFIQKVGGQLLVFDNEANALNAAILAETKPEPAAKVKISLVKAVAKAQKKEPELQELFKASDYERIVELYEDLMRQQDDEDIEMLLMSL
jgi:hypothetical protein